MSKEIPTTSYMQDGWDRGPTGCHPYKRGSRHNKIGMWVMWIFYGIIIVQIINLLWK
tara:strand:+ start:189 stop:359 length:171 start_codon:yes stop_codon:yes gene_type:complete